MAKIEGDKVNLDPLVFDVQASRIKSIILDDVDLLILSWAIDEDFAQQYHALSDQHVDKERAKDSKPSLVRCFAFEMDRNGMTVYIEAKDWFL